jgi:cardiolipin synthase
MATRVLTVPNQLTFLRLVFLPFFVILIYYDRYTWALVVLVAAGLTDALDGLLARWLNQRTALGAYLDPIADKLLLSSSFLTLALKHQLGWWLAILVLSRDLLILMAAAVILLAVGYRPFPPSFYGKATTVTQMVLMVLVIAGAAVGSRWLEGIERVFVYLVAAFTVISGLHYAVRAARQLAGPSS